MSKRTAALLRLTRENVKSTDRSEVYSEVAMLSFLLPEFIGCSNRMTLINKVTDRYLKERKIMPLNSFKTYSRAHPEGGRVEVTTRDYTNTHGKHPRGRGTWAFKIDGITDLITGSYTEARAEAVKRALEIKGTCGWGVNVEVLG